VKHAQRLRSRGRTSQTNQCPPRHRLLPVSSPGPHELDGRIASLLGWLRAAPVACPGARWIAKADDDTYIREDGWVAALHAIGTKRPQTGAPVVQSTRADNRDRNKNITVDSVPCPGCGGRAVAGLGQQCPCQLHWRKRNVPLTQASPSATQPDSRWNGFRAPRRRRDIPFRSLRRHILARMELRHLHAPLIFMVCEHGAAPHNTSALRMQSTNL